MIFTIAGFIPEVPTLLLTPILTYKGKVISWLLGVLQEGVDAKESFGE